MMRNIYEDEAKTQVKDYSTCWHHLKRKNVMRAMIRRVVPSGQKVLALDAGCGDGWYTGVLLEEGFLVVGLDLSVLRLARNKRTSKESDFLCADANNLPFRSQSFDLIMVAQFLEHMKSPNHTITILSQCLKPDGRFIVEVPCMTNLWDYFVEKVLRGRANWGLTIDATHKHFFSIDQIVKTVESSGLSVEAIQGSVHLNYALPLISNIVWYRRNLWFLLDYVDKILRLLKPSWGAIIVIVARME